MVAGGFKIRPRRTRAADAIKGLMKSKDQIEAEGSKFELVGENEEMELLRTAQEQLAKSRSSYAREKAIEKARADAIASQQRLESTLASIESEQKSQSNSNRKSREERATKQQGRKKEQLEQLQQTLEKRKVQRIQQRADTEKRQLMREEEATFLQLETQRQRELTQLAMEDNVAERMRFAEMDNITREVADDGRRLTQRGNHKVRSARCRSFL
jgi:hypothetical protein